MRNPFGNPGLTYNTGNTLAVMGAVAQIILNAHGGPDIAAGIETYFAGNLPAVAATLGTIAFFHGGRKYHRGDIRPGHLWSAVGAALIAFGIAGLSATDLALNAAILGGTLHVCGKIGSLIDPPRDQFYKYLPLLSRLPAIMSLGLDLAHPRQNILLSVFLIAANVIWARADIMLMPGGRAKNFLDKIFLI